MLVVHFHLDPSRYKLVVVASGAPTKVWSDELGT